ncbi:hypothetical protein KKC94_03355 [Patescibacteria group bacterium]|nr:hypothetical protein [Patescibacteria group bacterium]
MGVERYKRKKRNKKNNPKERADRSAIRSNPEDPTALAFKILGRDTLELLASIYLVVEEYEEMILEDELPIGLVLGAMDAEGVINDILQMSEEFTSAFRDKFNAYQAKFEAGGLTADEANIKLNNDINAALGNAFEENKHPILARLLSSAYHKNYNNQDRYYLIRNAHFQTSQSPYGPEDHLDASIKHEGWRVKTEVAKAHHDTRMSLVYFAKTYALCRPPGTPEDNELVEFRRLEVDEMFEDLRNLRFDTSEGVIIKNYQFPDGWKFFQEYKKIQFQLLDKASIICGVRVYYRPVGQSKERYVNCFLSRITGELTLGDGITSAKEIFNIYGQGHMYEWFRIHAIKLFNCAFKAGQLDNCILQDTEEITDEVEKAVQEVIQEEGPTPKAETEPKTKTAPIPTKEQFNVRNAKISNIERQKAVEAFGRLGFELIGGGRHPKLRKGQLKIPFPNEHSHGASSDDVSRYVKWAIGIINTKRAHKITYQDFVDAL